MRSATPPFSLSATDPALVLSVVVPVKNELENVGPLAAEIAEAVAPLGAYEILFVDDGSDDGTPERLAELALARPELRLLRLAENCGQSAAIRFGVEQARAATVATLDGDGQNDPVDLPRLVERLWSAAPAERLGMVSGRRVGRQDSWNKKISSRLANAVRRAFLHDGAEDTSCGLKAFWRDLFLQLPVFDHMHRFLPALVQREGWSLDYIVVRHRPRLRGTSKYGIGNRLWVGIVDLFAVRWLMKRRRSIPRLAATATPRPAPEARPSALEAPQEEPKL